jgi:homocysteine S-methyltransferase
MLADGSEFRGDYRLTIEQLTEFHLPRMTTLAAAAPDLLACETIPSLLEAQALVSCLHFLPSQKAWFSFSCADDQHVSHGEQLADCGRLLDSESQEWRLEGARWFGGCCGTTPQDIANLRAAIAA